MNFSREKRVDFIKSGVVLSRVRDLRLGYKRALKRHEEFRAHYQAWKRDPIGNEKYWEKEDLDWLFEEPWIQGHRVVTDLILTRRHKKKKLIDIFRNNIIVKTTHNFGYYKSFSESRHGSLVYKSLIEEEYVEKFKSLIFVHGNFFTKWFESYLRDKLKKKLKNQNNTVDLLLTSASNWHKRRLQKKHIFEVIPHDLMNVIIYRCSLDLEDCEVIDLRNKIIEREFEYRICECCGRKYQIHYFPDWVYFGQNANVNVCFECPSYLMNKEKTGKYFFDLIECVGFIPEKNTIDTHNFSKRLSQEKWLESYKILTNLRGEQILTKPYQQKSFNGIKEHFDSWFHALVETKVLPGGTRKNMCMSSNKSGLFQI